MKKLQMLFASNGEALDTFISVTKVAYVRTSSTTIESLGPLMLRLIRIGYYHVHVYYDHADECSSMKDCLK